jgi:hypothetical protein
VGPTRRVGRPHPGPRPADTRAATGADAPSALLVGEGERWRRIGPNPSRRHFVSVPTPSHGGHRGPRRSGRACSGSSHSAGPEPSHRVLQPGLAGEAGRALSCFGHVQRPPSTRPPVRHRAARPDSPHGLSEISSGPAGPSVGLAAERRPGDPGRGETAARRPPVGPLERGGMQTGRGLRDEFSAGVARVSWHSAEFASGAAGVRLVTPSCVGSMACRTPHRAAPPTLGEMPAPSRRARPRIGPSAARRWESR